MKLSILDQSPVVEGRSAADALQESMQLVELADRVGYHRYWFAEHHNSASFASASPLVMMAHAAARTTCIRLGSGGVLLGHASPLMVAEQIRTVQSLSNGRVDLGVGRAPGGDARVMQALGYDPRQTRERLQQILSCLRDDRMPQRTGAAVAVPDGVAAPEIWMLGTSVESARMAGEMGLRYAFGAFIDPTACMEALSTYHQAFTPGPWCERATTMVATVVFCGSTTDDAQRMARSSEQWFVRSFLRGEDPRFPTGEEPLAMDAREQVISAMRKQSVIIGDAATCVAELRALQQRTACDEIAVVTITARNDERLDSYEKLAKALFGGTGGGT